SERPYARLKEVIVPPDSRSAQNLAPDVHKRRFQPAARCSVHRGRKRLLPEPIFLNSLCKPVDVVQAVSNLLQALGSVSDTKCQSRAGREFFRVDVCRQLVPDRRRCVWIVLHACQACRWKGPGRTAPVPILIAEARDELPCRQILVRWQMLEFNKSFSF